MGVPAGSARRRLKVPARPCERPDRRPPISLDPATARVLRPTGERAPVATSQTSFDAGYAVQDVDALHELADRAAEHLKKLSIPPEDAVIGIYRQFGRSSRVSAGILRTMLAPATCHILTAVSSRWAARPDIDEAAATATLRPGALDLVVDVSRVPHPQARATAHAAGVPLLTRTDALPAMEPASLDVVTAVARGTAAARAIALDRHSRPAGSRPAATRAVSSTPARGRR